MKRILVLSVLIFICSMANAYEITHSAGSEVQIVNYKETTGAITPEIKKKLQSRMFV